MYATSISAMALALLVMTSGGVAAQMNSEEIPATFVTGIAGESGTAPEDGTATEDEGRVVYEQTVDWSDSRLPSTLRVNGAWYIYGPLPMVLEGEAAEAWEDQAVMVVEMNVLLEGAEGSWRGTGRAVEQGSESDPDRRYSAYLLEGEGAYEGMHVLLRGAPGHDAHGPWDEAYEGWIIEGEAPPLPEPPDVE